MCIWGRKETCLFWKLDTFPGQGRYLSSSTYVTKNSQVLAEENPWLLSSNNWRSCGPETRYDCVSGATLGWWKTSGECQSNRVKCSLLGEAGNTGKGLCFPVATNVQRIFPFYFLVGSQILTQVCFTKREFLAFLSFKNNHVFIPVDSPLETHGHKPILKISKGWKKGNVYISRKQCLFVGCVCSCMTLTFTLGQTFPYTRQISFGSQWIFIKSNVKSPIFTFQEWKVFAS